MRFRYLELYSLPSWDTSGRVIEWKGTPQELKKKIEEMNFELCDLIKTLKEIWEQCEKKGHKWKKQEEKATYWDSCKGDYDNNVYVCELCGAKTECRDWDASLEPQPKKKDK